MDNLFLIFVFILAGIVPELTGFGVATVSMALLPFVMPLSMAVPLVALISTITTGIIAVQTKAKTAWKQILPLVVGSIIGIPLGMLFLGAVPEDVLRFLLAAFLISYAIYGFFKKRSLLPRNTAVGVSVGTVAGFFAALFNIHGPLVGLYSSRSDAGAHRGRDVIAAYMFITGMATVIGHSIAGRVTEDVLTMLLHAIPSLIVGLLIGTYLFRIMSNRGRSLQFALYVFVCASGIGLLL